MEAFCALAASACAAALVYVLVGGEPAAQGRGAERLARSCARRLRAALDALAGSALVDALLRLDDWEACAGWACRWAQGRGARADERHACAAALLAAAASALAASALFATWLCLPVAAVGVALGVPAMAARRRDQLRKEMSGAMPAVFRMLAVAMGSGMTLVQSAEYAGAHAGGPAGEALARLGLRLRCGAATEEALSALARELPAPGVGLLAAALVISHRTGSPLKGLFQRSAVLVERQGEFERLLMVKTAQVRLSVRVVCLLPAVMVALLAAISPDFQKGLATPAGLLCVCAAALLDGVAVLIIRRLVQGALR